jgi:transposase
MNLPIRIGMDTSKSVFQLHGVDENEVVVCEVASLGVSQ